MIENFFKNFSQNLFFKNYFHKHGKQTLTSHKVIFHRKKNMPKCLISLNFPRIFEVLKLQPFFFLSFVVINNLVLSTSIDQHVFFIIPPF